jgi:hypothetical protein
MPYSPILAGQTTMGSEAWACEGESLFPSHYCAYTYLVIMSFTASTDLNLALLYCAHTAVNECNVNTVQKIYTFTE